MAACSELVVLRGGQVASLKALRLGWDLEARGFVMRPVGARLQVQPYKQLTPEDVAAIRHYRDELLALVSYEPRST
jgi:hypothetical protein